MDKVRWSLIGLRDNDDPMVMSWIVATTTADIGRGNVAGSRQPFGQESTLVWCRQARREVSNCIVHWTSAFP